MGNEPELFGDTNATAKRPARSRNRHTKVGRKDPSAQTAHQEKDGLSYPVALHPRTVRTLSAVRQLVDLLLEAKPLVEILNSPGTTPAGRALLRALVGEDQYFEVVGGLQDMTSERAWRAAHNKDFLPPEVAQEITELLARYDEGTDRS